MGGDIFFSLRVCPCVCIFMLRSGFFGFVHLPQLGESSEDLLLPLLVRLWRQVGANQAIPVGGSRGSRWAESRSFWRDETKIYSLLRRSWSAAVMISTLWNVRLTRVFEGRRVSGCIHWVLVEHFIRPDVGNEVGSQMRSWRWRWRCGGRGRSLVNVDSDSQSWDGRRAPPGHKHAKWGFSWTQVTGRKAQCFLMENNWQWTKQTNTKKICVCVRI